MLCVGVGVGCGRVPAKILVANSYAAGPSIILLQFAVCLGLLVDVGRALYCFEVFSDRKT